MRDPYRLVGFYLPFIQVSEHRGLRSTIFKPYSADSHVVYIQVQALGSSVVVGLDTKGVKPWSMPRNFQSVEKPFGASESCTEGGIISERFDQIPASGCFLYALR